MLLDRASDGVNEPESAEIAPPTSLKLSRPSTVPVGGRVFTRVKAARELLKSQAEEIYKLAVANAKMATGGGDYETASKTYIWLMEHMPAEDGERMIDASAAKPLQLESKPSAPVVNIGLVLGGTPQAKALRAAEPQLDVIDVSPIPESHE